MTEAEAKKILKQSGPPQNIAKHIEALHVAIQILGDGATMKEIWKWAETE